MRLGSFNACARARSPCVPLFELKLACRGAQPPLASQRAEKGRATGAQLLAAADAQAAAHAASAR